MDLTSSDPALVAAVFGLGGVALGGLVAGLFALLTGWLESRREHRRWLRERRFAAYRTAVSILDRVRSFSSAGTPSTLEEAERSAAEGKLIVAALPDAYNDVFIVGPRKVSASLMRATSAAGDMLGDSSDQDSRSAEFSRLRAQFVRDVQDQLRAGWPWQRVTQDDAIVFKEIQRERSRATTA